jgi:hypothetical protein
VGRAAERFGRAHGLGYRTRRRSSERDNRFMDGSNRICVSMAPLQRDRDRLCCGDGIGRNERDVHDWNGGRRVDDSGGADREQRDGAEPTGVVRGKWSGDAVGAAGTGPSYAVPA